MTILEKLKQSNMWDSIYDLPLSPQNNNPIFYLACCQKIVISNNEAPDFEFNKNIFDYLTKCHNKDLSLNRWPESPSQISHDELIGASYLSILEAMNIHDILDTWDGFYSNIAPITSPENYMARFPWFIQYVKARAGIKLSIVSQILWSYLLVWDMFKVKTGTNDASGRLIIWLMLEQMSQFWLCSFVIELWKWRMNKLGITLKNMFKLEPRENPIMVDIAPEAW